MTAREWLDNASGLREEVKSLAHTADFADDTDREIVELLLRKVDAGFNRLDGIAQDYIPDDQGGRQRPQQPAGNDTPPAGPQETPQNIPPRARPGIPPAKRR